MPDLFSLFKDIKNSRKTKLAVFDIDGTLFRSSLVVELIEALVKGNTISRKARESYATSYARWQNRVGNARSGYSYYEFIDDVIWAYRKYIKGVRRSEVWRVAEKVVDNNKSRLYRFTRDLVKKLRATHYLLALSHSPYEVVAPFAKELGFDKVYAMVYEVDSKVRYTGKVLYEDLILDKGKTLRRAIRRNNLNLKDSVGVGDTESDIEFLKLVDRSIAFNPSLKLYKAAQKHKWEIIVERKDVIYQIKSR